MGENLLSRQWNVGRILPDHEERIVELEKRSGFSASGLDLLLNPPACRVHNSAVQSIPDNTVTALTFDSERFDTDTMHDLAVNTSRITFNTAGIYAVGGGARIANGADYVTVNLRVRLNGTTDIVHSDALVSAGATVAQIKQVSTSYLFAQGDYVELLFMQDNTANAARNTVINANWSSEFWAVREGSGV